MADTSRFIMRPYKGLLYCEAHMDDEFTLDDLEQMRNEIRRNYNGCTDVILKKAGTYSVALDAQRILLQGIEEFRHFAYVVDNKMKRASAEFAAGSYMAHYHTQIAETKEEAYFLLEAIADER